MGEVEYNEFNNMYKQYHNNDYSLVCHNNILYYDGDTKPIQGFIGVVRGEQVNLGNYRVRVIDPDIWKLPPYLLFFNLRESINLHNIDINVINQELDNIISLINKNKLSEYEKTKLINHIDYYLALKQIQSTLRGKLDYYYNSFTQKVLPIIIKNNSNNYTEGYKLIYDKLYNEIISNPAVENMNESSGEEKGKQRTHNKYKNVHFSEDQYLIDDFEDNKKDFLNNTAAYINAVIIIVLTVAILFGIMMLIIR
jgi:hypothetical protein